MSNTVPTAENYGSLPIGTVLPEGLGVVLGRSYTAYLVTDDGGNESYVPFPRVHPLTNVVPLVTFGGAR